MPTRSRLWGNLLLCGIATLCSLAVIELGYRVAVGQPALTLKNWRAERIERRTLGDRAIYDPVLGWKLKTGYASAGYNTIAHGIRRNFAETGLRTGATLAVGDSFTDGWDDVDDAGTWPAQLEAIAGTPVLNGGVGGYATDQIIMRAEMLLPVARPKTLIVGFLDEDIFRSGHTSFGASKPYFTLAAGELTYHAPGPMVPPEQRKRTWRGTVRDLLGHSAVLDFVLGRLAGGYWYGSSGEEVFERADNDPVAVTCALLRRLKRQADAGGVRTLLFMQYGWRAVVEHAQPGDHAKQVMACAGEAGFAVVDQFASLRALAVSDLAALTALYAREGNGYGHLNATGNRRAAELLAAALN